MYPGPRISRLESGNFDHVSNLSERLWWPMTSKSTGDGFPDVVVTAVASSTALAPDAEDTWQQLLEGQSGIRRLDKPFVDEFELPVRIGGELREDFDQHLNRVELRRLSYRQKMSRVLSRRLGVGGGVQPQLPLRLMPRLPRWQFM